MLSSSSSRRSCSSSSTRSEDGHYSSGVLSLWHSATSSSAVFSGPTTHMCLVSFHPLKFCVYIDQDHRGCCRQCQRRNASHRTACAHRHRFFLSPNHHLRAYSRTDLLGLRGRSMVSRDPRDRNRHRSHRVSTNPSPRLVRSQQLTRHSNWVFNFAIGLFIPPAFLNIRWRLFIVFGALCLGGAIQFWFTYPETCGKTIEEIEVLFSNGRPPAWKTKKGDSRLHDEMAAVSNARAKEEARASIEKVVKGDTGLHQEVKSETA